MDLRYINEIAVTLGIILLLISLYFLWDTFRVTRSRGGMAWWVLILFLLSCFLISYAVIDYHYFTGVELFDFRHLVAQLALWVASFILICVRLFNRTIININEIMVRDQRLKADMQKRSQELEAMNRFMVDRELRVIELKKEVNQLLADSGQPKKYDI